MDCQPTEELATDSAGKFWPHVPPQRYLGERPFDGAIDPEPT